MLFFLSSTVTNVTVLLRIIFLGIFNDSLSESWALIVGFKMKFVYHAPASPFDSFPAAENDLASATLISSGCEVGELSPSENDAESGFPGVDL